MFTYDELINDIGSLKNRYSIFLFILINIASFSPDLFGILFILLPTNFRCNWTETLARHNFTESIAVSTVSNATINSTFDNQCSIDLIGINKTVKCEHFIFENNISMISEFNLVCDKAYWVNLIKGSYWLGYLCATPMGLLADKIGRKLTIIILSYILVISYYVSAFSIAPWMYFICHFFKGFCASLIYLFVILLMEISNIASRHVIGTSSWIGFTLMSIAEVGAAYLLQNWRKLQLFGAVSLSLNLIIPFFFPESPRWLLVKNKNKKAQETLDWLAIKNNKSKVEISNVKVKKEKKESCKALWLNKSVFIRILFSVFLWYAMSTVYYGIALNVQFASDNPYISQLASTLSEIPVIPFSLFVCWLAPYKKSIYCLISFIVGALLVVYFFQDYFVLRLIVGSLGKFAAASLFLIIIIFTEELYPTEFRTTGHNLTNLSRISIVIIPYIIDLKSVHPIIPVLIMCVTGTLMLISVMPFPETKGWPLPQKIEDLRKIKWSNINQSAAKSSRPNIVSLDLEESGLKENIDGEIIGDIVVKE